MTILREIFRRFSKAAAWLAEYMRTMNNTRAENGDVRRQQVRMTSYAPEEDTEQRHDMFTYHYTAHVLLNQTGLMESG